MIQDSNDELKNDRIKFQFLLRQLPIKERAAWMQVRGNQSQLSYLKQWINAKKIIQKIIDDELIQ